MLGGDHVSHVVHQRRGELLVFQSGVDVALDPHLVPGRGYPDGLQLVARAFFLENLLDVLRQAVPDVSVYDDGVQQLAGQRPDHVVGHFVPALGVGGESHRDAAVEDAPLQGRVDFGEGHELGVGSEPLDPVGEGRAVAAHLAPLEVRQFSDAVLAEEELVAARNPHVREYLAAIRVFGEQAVQLGPDCLSNLELHLVVWIYAVHYCQLSLGHVPGDVAAGDFRPRQGAVGYLLQGIGPGYSQLREGCDRHQHLTVGAGLDLGLEEVGPQFARGNRAVDAGELDFDGFAVVGHFRGVGEVGLFHQVLVVVGVEEVALPLQAGQVDHVVGVAQALGRGRAHQPGEVTVAEVEGAGAAGPRFGGSQQGRVNVRVRHRRGFGGFLLLHCRFRGGGSRSGRGGRGCRWRRRGGRRCRRLRRGRLAAGQHKGHQQNQDSRQQGYLNQNNSPYTPDGFPGRRAAHVVDAQPSGGI